MGILRECWGDLWESLENGGDFGLVLGKFCGILWTFNVGFWAVFCGNFLWEFFVDFLWKLMEFYWEF